LVESIAHDTAIGPPLSIRLLEALLHPPEHTAVSRTSLLSWTDKRTPPELLCGKTDPAHGRKGKNDPNISLFIVQDFHSPFPFLTEFLTHPTPPPSSSSRASHTTRRGNPSSFFSGEELKKRETFGRHRFFAVQHGISGDSAFPKMREKDLIINDLMKISPLLLRTTPVRNGKLGRSAKHLRLLFLGRGKLTPVSIESKRRRRLPHSTFHRVKTTVSPDKNLS
jgi:hypothetical protein